MSTNILVTGATSRVGRLVVDELLSRGVHVRALTRDAGHAGLPTQVEVVAGDFTVAESLDNAMSGVDAVFLVWTAPLAAAAEAIARLTAFVPGEARRRIVYLSAPHQTPHPFFQQPNAMRAVHAEVERLLAAMTPNAVILRPGMFASNALHWWAPQIRRGNVVRWPYADVETAPIDERDIAAVAGFTLLGESYGENDLVLTGPQSLSHADQVHAIGETIGRSLVFEELSPDEFRRETAGTWPPGVADMLLSAWGASVGRRAYVTSAVQAVRGTPARTFQQWASDNAAAFG